MIKGHGADQAPASHWPLLTKIDLWLAPDVLASHLFDLKAFQAPQIRLIIYRRPLAAPTSGSLRLALRIANLWP